MLLVGDIGGTYARLALVPENGSGERAAEEVFASRDYNALEEVISDFLRRHGSSIDHAVFAVAGPVMEDTAELTNLGWHVNAKRLRKALGAQTVRLVNDLQALAYAVPALGPDSVRTLQAGTRQPGGSIAVLAPGTGLGQAFLTQDTTRYRAFPSEAGHADFAPADDVQMELLRWLRQRFDHVSYERVCSGSGIPNLFDFLEQRGELRAENWLTAQLASAKNATPIIVDAGVDGRGKSQLCAATLELFAKILAAEAGNAALRVLATGGVYLGGTLVQRLQPIIEKPDFLDAFRAKGRLSDVLRRVPLHIITRPNAALFGAIQFGLAELAAIG